MKRYHSYDDLLLCNRRRKQCTSMTSGLLLEAALIGKGKEEEK
jgi:hypothetical protein